MFSSDSCSRRSIWKNYLYKCNQATAILYTDSSCSNQAASGSVTGDGNSCGIIYQTSNNSPAASGKVQCDKTSSAANGFTTIFVGAVAACIVAFLI